MKKEIKYLLYIVIMMICVNSTNVYALDNSTNIDNTAEKDVVIDSTITPEENNNESSSLNNSSDTTNEKQGENAEETEIEIDNNITPEENEAVTTNDPISEENNNDSSSSNNPSDTTNVEQDENIEQDENTEEIEELTNNNELPTLDELNKLDKNLEFTEEKLIVKGNLFDYTNTTFIKEIINKEEISSKYNLKIQIIDKFDNSITEDINIDNDYYLVFTNDKNKIKFKIEFLFDFDQNYIVNEEDKIKLLELIAEDSTIIENDRLSYFDYVLKNKTYDTPKRGDISLDTVITTEKDHYDYGNEFDVTITNLNPPEEIIEEDKENLPSEEPTEETIENDDLVAEEEPKNKKIYINIISGKINYNHNALKLLNITFENYKNLSTEEDSYLFWVDNLEKIRINLRFKAINQNSREYITISESNVYSEGKKINTEEMCAKVTLNKIAKPETPKPEKKVNKTSKPKVKKPVRVKNSDSYASEISIKDHLVEFNYLTKNYVVKADYSETSLIFDVTLRDKEYATYEISGNNNFKVGENLVVVTVTAEDGSKTEYKYNVIRMPKKDFENKKSKNIGYDLLSMNIFVGAIIVAIGLIYKLISHKLNR